MSPNSLPSTVKLTLLLLISCYCAISSPCFAQTEPAEPRWSAPDLENAISIREGHTGKQLSFEQLITELAAADVVFLGESHTDETTHRFQLAVYERLINAREQKVVLSMEMFERDVQPQLDRYLRGEISEADFLSEARPWSNYREAYRPLIEHAKQAELPVVAANFPVSVRRRLAMEGPEVLDKLSPEEKSWIPAKLYPNSPDYWKRTDNATRSHAGFMSADDSDDGRLYSTQSLWDNAMGQACADALDAHPGSSVLHLNGKFHTAYWDGTVHQLKQRKPNAKVKTISLTPQLNPSTAKLVGKPVADYVVFTESRATNVESGERSVQVGRELKYHFHLPSHASEETPAPLLIWLTDDGLTSQEAMRLCKQQFGEEAAIAVLEAPYKQIGEDLEVGGRWFWPNSFSEDVSLLVDGTEKMWAYLSRHYPLDQQHVCVVGQGTGATVAAVIAVQAERMSHRAIALRPSRYSKVKDIPLPLPEFYRPGERPKTSLAVLGDETLRQWWQDELSQYNEVDISSEFHSRVDDPWEMEAQTENLVRSALGLEALESPTTEDRQYVLVESSSPRALHWAKLQAAKLSASSNVPTVAVSEVPARVTAKPISTDIHYEAVLREGTLPRCPGPFGGTTVLVLPPNLSEAETAQWLAIEENDPIAAKSRFHRVRIASATGEHDLPAVLTKLQSENRKNVLIVPAVFYADPSWLRELSASVHGFNDSMTLQWRAGLGGRPGILDE